MTFKEFINADINADTQPTMVEVFLDWGGLYRWRLIASDGRTIRRSTRYPTRASARQSAETEGRKFGVETILDDR